MFRYWDVFVDVVTVFWLAVFILGEVSDSYAAVCSAINCWLLPIFFADLFVRYRRVGDAKLFLKKHWFDILIAIPYLRFLRLLKVVKIVKMLRLVKVVKTCRGAKLVKTLTRSVPALCLKYYKALRKVLRVRKLVSRFS